MVFLRAVFAKFGTFLILGIPENSGKLGGF